MQKQRKPNNNNNNVVISIVKDLQFFLKGYR